MVKFVMESFEANILAEDMMKMISNPNGSISTPRRIHLSHPRKDEVIKSVKEQNYSKSRRMIVILL
jgi:hypothetical protein